MVACYRQAAVAVMLLVSLAAGHVFAEPLQSAPGVALVKGHCSACHGIELVTSQRGNREFWQGLIRWMQAEHNLWPLPPAQENAILDYLATYYGSADQVWGRRPLLAPELLP